MEQPKATLRRVWSHKGSLALISIMVVSVMAIVRSLNAPADTVSRPSDMERAKRIESSGDPAKVDSQGKVGGERAFFKGVAANGVIEPMGDEILLASEAPGVVEEIFVREGEKVKKGQVLAQFRADVEFAQKKAAEAEVHAARIRLELARTSYERTLRLSRDRAVTAEELDRSEKSYALERSLLLAAEARLAQSQALLQRLTLRAPLDGEILKIHCQLGEYYNPSTMDAFLVMGDVRELRVRIELDERDLARVATGTRGYFTADAFGEERFSFVLTEMGRRMGRKILKSDDPREKNDTRVLSIYGKVEGTSTDRLVSGLRVTAFMEAHTPPPTSH